MVENKEQITYPYVSYPAFKAFIAHLKDTIVTGQIDNTMMPNTFSGSVRAGIISALKALCLVLDNGDTTQELRDLVEAYNSKGWQVAVKNKVLSNYDSIVGNIDLKSATRKQVNEMFGDTTPQMRDKYIRFFLSAYKDAGIEYSPHLKIRKRIPRKRIGKITPKHKAAAKRKDEPQGQISNSEQTPSNMFDQPIPITSEFPCFIRIPMGITKNQVELVKAAVAFIEAMAKQNEESK